MNKIDITLTDEQIEDLKTKWVNYGVNYRKENTEWWYDEDFWLDAFASKTLSSEFALNYLKLFNKYYKGSLASRALLLLDIKVAI